jgi:broad specificity phosphatase PhoE
MKYAWILLALCLAACTAEDGPPDYTLYLVRHAEKMKGEGDVELTIAGHTRAAQLSGWLEDRGIEGIWSSNTRRTMQTAAPLQATLGLGIYRYDPALLEELAERLRVAGRNALVVGHSNTTPLLASLLCDCEVAEMDDRDYDRLLVVEMRDGKGKLTTLSQAAEFMN